MARARYGFDEKKIERFLKQGRGQGEGKGYLPWLKVRDVPSSGRSSRPMGRTTDRIHHLLSDIEFRSFLIYDWADEISDIREQFPLDRDQTQQIALEMGVAHSADWKTHTPLVMTSDFLLDFVSSGHTTHLARAVKPSAELRKPRVLEKLEIERRYWKARGVDWGIVTERDLPMDLVKNLEWLQSAPQLDDLEQPYPGFFSERLPPLTHALTIHSTLTLRSFCAEMDKSLNMERGAALRLVRYLLSTKVWRTNLFVPLLNKPIQMSQFLAIGTGGDKMSVNA